VVWRKESYVRTWLQTLFMKIENQMKQNYGSKDTTPNYLGGVRSELKCVRCGQAFSAGPFDTEASTFVCPTCDNGKDD